jgi:hypothetical protein
MFAIVVYFINVSCFTCNYNNYINNKKISQCVFVSDLAVNIDLIMGVGVYRFAVFVYNVLVKKLVICYTYRCFYSIIFYYIMERRGRQNVINWR